MGQSLSRVAVETPPEERKRLVGPNEARWRQWGCYTSDRQWGTVREDYSRDGEAWSWFSHDDARSRAYRWGEDALLGYSDDQQLLNFSLVAWNGADDILKERLFGLTNDEGPHGEDVKEVYYFLDGTPTSSYMKGLYRYPMAKFPYGELVRRNRENRQKLWDRRQHMPEVELPELGVFDNDRFWDITVEYAKNDPEDTSIRINVENCADSEETIHILPSLYYRNTWSWYKPEEGKKRPHMRLDNDLAPKGGKAVVSEPTEGLEEEMVLLVDGIQDDSQMLFCENETRIERFEGRSICRNLYKTPSDSPYLKDSINNAVVSGDSSLTNPARVGSKMAAHVTLTLPAKSQKSLILRLLPKSKAKVLSDSRHKSTFSEKVFETRRKEADAFYKWVSPCRMTPDRATIQRQAFAGMLWTRQTYIFDVSQWLAEGPEERLREGARNRDWIHLSLSDVISVCDGWEYPWFACWDLAFHLAVYAMIDPAFAKSQCLLLLRPGVCHPNGAPPAYEWEFSDFNPPLLAWAAYKVFNTEFEVYGEKDTKFLQRSFPSLNRFFSWYLLSADIDGHRLIGKSFLGLDNIAVVNRSEPPDTVDTIYQADGTAWGGFLAMNLMKIALELDDPVFHDFAAQFYVNAAYLASALNNFEEGLPRPGYDHPKLFSPEGQWYYDVIKLSDGNLHRLDCRTLVGVVPLFAIETFPRRIYKTAPDFLDRVNEFLDTEQRRLVGENIMNVDKTQVERNLRIPRRKFGVYMVDEDKLRNILRVIFDPAHFLSEYGIRSASKDLEHNPYRFDAGEGEKEYKYMPAESYGDGKLFGGNSSWRGAIWFPTNYMLIESLLKYHEVFGSDYQIEYPTGSGVMMTLKEIACDLGRRLVKIFDPEPNGRRPVFGPEGTIYNGSERWRKNPLFYEYFHGDSGVGVGASHQTGWTGLVADLIARLAYVDQAQLVDRAAMARLGMSPGISPVYTPTRSPM